MTKNCWKPSHIFVFILSRKGWNWFHKTLHNSGMVGRRKLHDPSLNRIFNALLVGVQYTLSSKWTNFGLKYLPLTRLGDLPLRRHWVFHLRLVWEVEEALLHPLETSSRRTNKMSWRRNTETSWWCSTKTSLLWVSFETYLWRH